MASVIQEDSFRCAVCYEDFMDPRNLDCGHTFCLRCLENIPVVRKRLSCPTCRQVTFLGTLRKPCDLGKPLLLNQLQQRWRETRARSVTCEGCSVMTSQEDVYCYTCRIFLCKQCWQCHTQICRGHLGETLSSISFCTTHVKHPHDGKCSECEVYICQMCRLGHHRAHACLSAGSLRDETLKVIQPLLDKTQICFDPEWRNKLRRLRKEIQNPHFLDGAAKMRCALSKASEKLDNLISAFDENKSDQLAKLDELETKILNNLECEEIVSIFAESSQLSIKSIEDVKNSLQNYTTNIRAEQRFTVMNVNTDLTAEAESLQKQLDKWELFKTTETVTLHRTKSLNRKKSKPRMDGFDQVEEKYSTAGRKKLKEEDSGKDSDLTPKSPLRRSDRHK